MATYYAGVALVSAATFLLQIALLRLFAVQQFYHFAFMAVSLALLGFGASGSVLSVLRRRPAPAPLCLGFSLTALGAYLIINYLPFDSFSIAWDRRQVLYLALYFLAAAVPFLFSGLLVGAELMVAGRSGRSHLVYAANLVGAALGALLGLLALRVFGGVGTVVLAALAGAGAAFLFPSRGRFKPTSVLAGLVIAGSLTALAFPPDFLVQRLSPYKTLSTLLQVLDAEHTVSRWDATARVDVVESGTVHVMPGLSLVSPVGPPRQAAMMLDGDGLMPISALPPDSEEARHLAEHMPLGLAYRLRPSASTLVLGAGTGLDALLALAAGASQVTAAEEKRLVIETVRDAYGTFTGGLYNDPRVTVVNHSGRVFARSLAPGSFDMVTVALTDPHRPVTSGAYSLTEDYRYTTEAFGDYLGALSEGGLLLVTRWLQNPPSESARLFGTAAAALERSGRNPAAHLVAFRSMRTMTVIAGEEAFSAAELELVRDFLRSRGYDGVYYHGIQENEVNRYNILPEPVYYRLFSEILQDPDAVYRSYRFDICPITDDRPFFFHYFKWAQTPEVLANLGRTWQPFGGSGFFVLLALLVLVGMAATAFIVGPLLLRSVAQVPLAETPPTDRLLSWQVFVYFACLGLAFLFVEVALAQRFILILGQPVTALAVILFALLLFSGLGSSSVRRWPLRRALLVLIVLIVSYPFLLGPLSALALRLPEEARLVLAVLALAPLGYFMGLPFAGGLRIVEARRPMLVPWAWAINGSVSVVSAVLAVALALSWGFSAVLWLGAVAYGGALLALRDTPG